jgi:DNA polymerase elongation subunit (family B)
MDPAEKVMMTQKSCYIWEGSVVQFDFRAMIAYFPEDPFNGPFLLLIFVMYPTIICEHVLCSTRLRNAPLLQD